MQPDCLGTQTKVALYPVAEELRERQRGVVTNEVFEREKRIAARIVPVVQFRQSRVAVQFDQKLECASQT